MAVLYTLLAATRVLVGYDSNRAFCGLARWASHPTKPRIAAKLTPCAAEPGRRSPTQSAAELPRRRAGDPRDGAPITGPPASPTRVADWAPGCECPPAGRPHGGETSAR